VQTTHWPLSFHSYPRVIALTLKLGEADNGKPYLKIGKSVDVVSSPGLDKQPSPPNRHLLVRNATILALSQRMGGEPDTVQTITLLITPQEAETLVLSSQSNRLQFLPTPSAFLARKLNDTQEGVFCWRHAFEWKGEMLEWWASLISNRAIKCGFPILDPISPAHP
jgi:hypothetical protein